MVANEQNCEGKTEECDGPEEKITAAPAVMGDEPLCGGRQADRADATAGEQKRECEATMFVEPGKTVRV